MYYITLLYSCVIFQCIQLLKSEHLFKIEGKVTVPYTSSADWLTEAKILIDGGQYLAFFKLM